MRLHHLRATLMAALALGACVDGEKSDSDSGDSSTDDTSGPQLCAGGVSLMDAFGNVSGFEQCGDGTIHRASVETTSAVISDQRCAGTEVSLACTVDADCTDRPNGACLTGVMVDGPDTYCGCAYACASDLDCNAGEFCAPAGIGAPYLGYSTCAPASCSVDTDCASLECGLSVWNDGCQDVVSLQCRSGMDTCREDADCGGTLTCDVRLESWECLGMDCAIGRPLVHEGEALRAPLAQGPGWADTVTLPCDSDARAAIAARWVQIAAMEHASVASFARFTLELMALGAPSELLLAAQEAAADEVRHARYAYGVASALAGQALGPGPMALHGVQPATNLRDFVLALVTEACVGETLGAAEALESAELCADPALQAAMRGVAEDEARHAALAWRTLRWALRDADDALRAEVRAAADAALRPLLAPPAFVHAPAWGLPGTEALRAIRLRAERQVLRPLLDAALRA